MAGQQKLPSPFAGEGSGVRGRRAGGQGLGTTTPLAPCGRGAGGEGWPRSPGGRGLRTKP